MKKILLASLVCVFAACGGDGETGPQGPAGADGEAGAAGSDGTAGMDGAPGMDGMDGMNGVLTPSINGVSPTSAFTDRTLDVLISGNGTEWTAPTVDFGVGVTVNSADLASPTAIIANITIDGTAAGTADVTVTDGGEALTFTQGFTVESPLVVNVETGDFVQGGIADVAFNTIDTSSPFIDVPDPVSIAVGNGAGVDTFPGPFAGFARVRTGVLTTAGLQDIVVTDGAGTISRAVGAADVVANAPTVVTVGVTATATSTVANEPEIFQIVAPANNAVTIDFSTDAAAPSLRHSVLTDTGDWGDAVIIDEFGTQIVLPVDAADQTYYVVIVDRNDFGTYTVDSVAQVVEPEVEANDDFGTAQAVTPPVLVNAMIDVAGDNDFFSIALTAGQTLDGETFGCTGGMDTVVQLLDVDGMTVLDSNDDFNGLCSFVSATAAIDGTYFVSVRHFDGNDTGSYQLSLSIQ